MAPGNFPLPVVGIIMKIKVNVAARGHLTKRFHESSAPVPVDGDYVTIAADIAKTKIDEIRAEYGDVKIDKVTIEITDE
jgi:hypothetical protein